MVVSWGWIININNRQKMESIVGNWTFPNTIPLTVRYGCVAAPNSTSRCLPPRMLGLAVAGLWGFSAVAIDPVVVFYFTAALIYLSITIIVMLGQRYAEQWANRGLGRRDS